MTVHGQQAVPDWVALGDGSRFEFLSWILGEKRIDAKHRWAVWVQYGIQFSQRNEEEACWVKCSRMLPGTSCYFPYLMDGEYLLNSKVNTVSDTKFLIFEEFPFQKEETDQWIDSIRMNKGVDVSVVVVLVDLPRRYGSTDMEHIDPQERINIARRHYEQSKEIPVIVARSQSDVIPVFNWREPLRKIWDRKARNELQGIKERVDYFHLDYEETCILELQTGDAFLSLDTRKEVFSLSSIERYKKSTLWENCTEAILAKAFPSNRLSGLFPAVDLYCEVFDRSPLAVWNKAEDRETCVQKLKNALYEKLTRNQGLYPDSSPAESCSFIGGGELEHKLWNLVEEFVKHDIPEILQLRLIQKYNKLEEIFV